MKASARPHLLWLTTAALLIVVAVALPFSSSFPALGSDVPFVFGSEDPDVFDLQALLAEGLSSPSLSGVPEIAEIPEGGTGCGIHRDRRP